MEKLTIEQIYVGLAFLFGLYILIKKVHVEIKESISKLLDDRFDSIEERLDSLDKKITENDAQQCKNYIIRCLSDIENGNEMSPSEEEHFWKQYDHYTLDLKLNTYIKKRVARLEAKGLLVRTEDKTK